MGEWRYSSSILDLGTRWRSGQIHILAALHPNKELPVPTKFEDGWAPELVWALWRKEKSLALAGNRTPAVQPAIPTELSWLLVK
jgi:hypothetical protein